MGKKNYHIWHCAVRKQNILNFIIELYSKYINSNYFVRFIRLFISACNSNGDENVWASTKIKPYTKSLTAIT